MALTPEDVVNKRFQHVKFRDGYDQDEVDDFLDEVVVELRRLYQENDELRQQLSAAEQRASELPQGEPVSFEEPGDFDATQAMPAALPEPAAAPAAPAAPLIAPQASVEAPVQPEAPEPAEAPESAAVAADKQDAHGLIMLAQRLHDEHLAEGEATRDRLISEAEQTAAEIVGEAEKKRDDTLRSLETEKSNLERTIDGLENFERQYRTRLKSYLNDQLRDLESSGSLAPETLNGGQPGGAAI